MSCPACSILGRCVHPPVVLERGPHRFYGLCAPLKMPSLEAWPVFGSMSIAWCEADGIWAKKKSAFRLTDSFVACLQIRCRLSGGPASLDTWKQSFEGQHNVLLQSHVHFLL